MFADFVSKVKRFLRGERLERPRPKPTPTPCNICGGEGFYPMRSGGWLCSRCFPPFMRPAGGTR